MHVGCLAYTSLAEETSHATRALIFISLSSAIPPGQEILFLWPDFVCSVILLSPEDADLATRAAAFVPREPCRALARKLALSGWRTLYLLQNEDAV